MSKLLLVIEGVGADAFLTKPADIPLPLKTIAELTDRA